eukprot:7994147-Pyramimonas_sp.AAC.1
MAHIWPPRPPRAPREGPKKWPGSSKRPPGCPKRLPRDFHEAPRPRGAQDAPRGLGENTKSLMLLRAPGRAQDDLQYGSRYPMMSHMAPT